MMDLLYQHVKDQTSLKLNNKKYKHLKNTLVI